MNEHHRKKKKNKKGKTVVICSENKDVALLFEDFERKVTKALVENGYCVVICRSNKNFFSPEVVIEAFCLQSGKLIDTVLKLIPAVQRAGPEFEEISSIKHLRGDIPI